MVTEAEELAAQAKANVSNPDHPHYDPTYNPNDPATQSAMANGLMPGQEAAATSTTNNPATPEIPPTAPTVVPSNGDYKTLGQALKAGVDDITNHTEDRKPVASNSQVAAIRPTATSGSGNSIDNTYIKDRKALNDQEKGINTEANKRTTDDLYQLSAAHDIYNDSIRKADLQRKLDDHQDAYDRGKTQRMMEARDADRDAKAQDLFNTKIDPQHWYKEKGTAGSIVAALSIAAGAFAAAMPHTGSHVNQAEGIINNAIDRDVDAQKSNLDKKWKLLNWQGTQDEKKAVQAMWMDQQNRDARRDANNAVKQQAAQMLQGTTDQVAINGLKTVIDNRDKDNIKLTEQSSDLAYSIHKKEQAQAAAAQASNPYSATNLTKGYAAYTTKANEANLAHPDKPVAIMSRDQWLNTQTGGGVSAPSGSGSRQQLDVVNGLKGIKELYQHPIDVNTPEGRGKLKAYAMQIKLGLPFLQSGSRRLMETELQLTEDMLGSHDLIKGDFLGERTASIDTILKSLDGTTPDSDPGVTEDK